MMIGASLVSPRPAYRPGSAHSPAMERLVPGDYPQVEEDLARFPQPVLDFLSRSGVRVAVLEEGQTLADAPGLRTMDPDEVRAEDEQVAQAIASYGTPAPPRESTPASGWAEYGEGLTRHLRAAGFDHLLGVAMQPFSLEELAEARSIPPEHRASWAASFERLNRGRVEWQGEQVLPQQGLVVLPHTFREGQAVPEIRWRNAQQVNAEYVKESLGLHRPEEAMVLLHDAYVAWPCPELGNYRLAVHEVGHALDHTLDRVGQEGFGSYHRQTIEELFAADLARLAAGEPPERVFTSDRADDDVREYFAEAVEAYLTPQQDNGHETFRASNSREGLAQRNPALYAYVEGLLTSDVLETAEAARPQRTFAPPGFPDPDLEVIRLS